ncbi:dTDP-4-dehydrorhamnose reductase [Massilia glaciei]|uniref:dTDP-4-dehydrorhamnose reductase n=1 Tax=Massilia glaciei TaxID=1524097 RepID=A0A2U2HNB0_9BURK|nr:dTDP-4-dehydrorhamnose reductase [Massilia glaciei]PWF48916.1 dTDP-4-dehydrorhamnose reductase [Massilia glaciei]
MKRILLTGKHGQVGYELERCLRGLGDIVAVGRGQMDLSDLDQVRQVIRAVRPDLIINPAAYTAVDKAENEATLAMRINAEAPRVMAEEAAWLGAGMIHFSTDYVFDGSKDTPYTEDDPCAPINVYGRSKLAGERAVAAVGLPHLILRTSWVYGRRGNNFLLTVQRLARERAGLSIVADQFGAPTWSRTVAEATARIVAANGGAIGPAQTGLYHLTAQGETSWHGFAAAIVAHRSSPKKPALAAIEASRYPTAARRPQNSRLSSQRFIERFGPLPRWDEALALCLDCAVTDGGADPPAGLAGGAARPCR